MIIAATLAGCGSNQKGSPEDTVNTSTVEVTASETDNTLSETEPDSDVPSSHSDAPDESAPTDYFGEEEQTEPQYSEPEINFSDLV